MNVNLKYFLSLRQRITIAVNQIALAVELFRVSPNIFWVVSVKLASCHLSEA
jgi:uncharacterized hydantoinase/oxoprolinase family protein